MTSVDEHRCHAVFCSRPCAPERLMCPQHWRMVPEEIQKKMWAEYRVGQCDDKRPSSAWLDAANAAIDAVRDLEMETYINPGADGKIPICALTVKQPWASLIAKGIKDVENREWFPFRMLIGRLIAIHAGSQLDMSAYPFVKDKGLLEACGSVLSEQKLLPRGGIIAVAKLSLVEGPECLSPWYMGGFAWRLTEVVEIEPMVQCRGNQGLWRVRGSSLDALRARYAESRSRHRPNTSTPHAG